MSYFSQISPEAEELLREIIDLKITKSGKAYRWNSEFNEMKSNDELIYRSLFGELQNCKLINVFWASGIPYNLTLTNNGENYFKHKKIFQQEVERNRQPMGFEYLDNESETLLSDIVLAYKEDSQLFSNDYKCAKISSEIRIWRNLCDSGLLEGKVFEDITGSLSCSNVNITQKGKTYFERKERYEMQLDMNKSNITNITTGDNSPVNLAIDGSVATQTVDYANNDQLKALSHLADMIVSAKEFTDEEKTEILELIDGVKDATQSKKKAVFKTLVVSLDSVLSKAPAFIIDKWREIQEMFNIQL